MSLVTSAPTIRMFAAVADRRYNERVTLLSLHEFHQGLGARFAEANGAEVVGDYGDALAEHCALRESAGILDLSFRGRICLTGADRVRFLHGQVTNDIRRLSYGQGCYAALVTPKGKMESDLNIYCLQDELLLDFEPGLTESISRRLEKYIVADDVQIVDVAPHYGLLSVQGPGAEGVVRSLGLFDEALNKLPSLGVPPSGGPIGAHLPDRVNAELQTKQFSFVKISDPTLGEIYLMNRPQILLPLSATQERGEGRGEGHHLIHSPSSPRPSPPSAGGEGVTTFVGFGSGGFDLFVPTNSLAAVADKLIAAAKSIGGRACGWTAFETARIEAGIPRFGVDMDSSNIPLECGIESGAVSYSKGCYIGQEVLNRIHSIGHVNRELRGLQLADDLKTLPAKGDKLFFGGKEVGYITSALASPALKKNIALGYVRREANQIGTELMLQTADGESRVKITELPFAK